jgi:transposase
MDQTIRIGIDTSKHVFQLHGVNAADDEDARIGGLRSASHFAAWLALIPKDHSTAGEVRH